MFMVRVVFWLTVVALLMPREPDVGLGAPGAGHGFSLASISESVSAPAATRALPSCKQYQSACETGLAVVDDLQTAALIGLARVKVEIERQKRGRGHL